MERIRIFLFLGLLTFALIAAASAPPAQQPQPASATIASAVDRQISGIEKQMLEVVEAMPEEKFNTFAVAHAFDHYGQMVEYLRMNGIVPPASRAKPE